MRPSSPRSPTRRRKGRSIVVLAKEKYGIRGRDMGELNAKFIPFSAQTRMSGVEFGGTSIRKGAVDAILGHLNGGAAAPAARAARGRACKPAVSTDAARELQAIADAHRQVRRHAAGRGARRQAARRHPSQGHRQGRHPRALRGAAAHGHPHHHDHRRQPDDGGRHRGGGRRRRLPRPGDAGGQAAGSSATSRPRASWWPCAATAPTMRPRSRRPMSASP